jgi:hypothetical protein
MAEGDSRQNKVYKAMNRPLTILGAERRLFFVALITGGAERVNDFETGFVRV